MVKNLSPMQETQETRVRSLGGKDPLEKEIATGSSILVSLYSSILQSGKSLGQRSPAGYIVLGVASESDRT